MLDTPTEAEIAAHFAAMDDSVELINKIVTDDTNPADPLRTAWTVAEVKLMVTRNTDHLEIQAAKDWYAESSKDKSSYDDAVAVGKAYVEA